MRRATAAHPANTMTKHTMTKALISVIEGALVGLAVVISWRMVVTIISL
jgi:hypothetical protein